MAYQVVVKIDEVLEKNAPGYKAAYYTFIGGGGGLVTQSCLTLATLRTVARQAPLPGILQATILEWVAISFSKGSCKLRDRTRVSCISGRFFTN